MNHLKKQHTDKVGRLTALAPGEELTIVHVLKT